MAMAKKSEFAQKLLDDLRLRKQKMAATSRHTSPSDSSQHMIRRTNRGSRDDRVSITNGRHDKTELLHHRFLTDQFSKEIILPTQGGSRGSKHTIDMHVALAFALENYGRLEKLEVHGSYSDRMLLDSRPMTQNKLILSDKSHLSLPVGLPALSHLQINEISRGAQKLHQILKACSKGINYDRYTIDMGRELLKGAMDLEESLKFLINLQEASECSVHSQKKKIQLLEGDEEEGDAQQGMKEMSLIQKPTFSFDRVPTTKPLGRGEHEQKLLGSSAPQASWLNQHNKSNSFGNATSEFLSHRHTQSLDWDSHSYHACTGTATGLRFEKFPISSGIPTSASGNKISEQKPLGPKKGKGRIPNVIAKLMGLEELPPSHEPKTKGTDRVAKEGTELIRKAEHTLQLTSAKGTKRRATQDSATDTVVVEEKWKSYGHENTEHSIPLVKAEKGMNLLHQQEGVKLTNKMGETPCAPIPSISGQRKVNANEQKETEKMIPIWNEDSKQTSSKVSTQLYIGQTKEPSLTKLDADFSQPNPYLKKKQSTGKADHMVQNSVVSTLELNLKGQEEALSTSNSTQARDGQLPRRNGIQFQKDQKVSKHQNSMRSKYEGTSSSQSSEPSVQQKMHLHNDKHMAMRMVDQTDKIKPIVREGKKGEILKNALKHVQKTNPEKRSLFPNKRSSKENINVPQNKEGRNSPTVLHHTEQLLNGSSEEQKHDDSKEQGNPVDPISPSLGPTSPTFVMYHEGTPPKRIEENRVTSETLDPGKIDESRKEQVGTHSTEHETKEGASLPQKLTQRRQRRIIQAKESAPSIQMATDMEEQVLKQSLLGSCSSNCIADNCRRPRERVPTDIKDKASEVVAVQQLSVPLGEDQIIPASSHINIQLEATLNHQNVTDGFVRPQHQNKTFSRSSFRRGSLTEQERNLKQNLITSQLFLTAAVAFFKLHIPISILQYASCHKLDENRESKLVLDCAYEIMKRKGRREELVFHPSVTVPIASMKIKTLDDLVKELNKELAHLQRDMEPEGDDCEAARYLHKILEREIKDTNPDANCMWEFGWNCSMLAYIEQEEVIRDVEKHLLNRLIEEIIGDHLQKSTTKT